jgi:hypothetical protein
MSSTVYILGFVTFVAYLLWVRNSAKPHNPRDSAEMPKGGKQRATALDDDMLVASLHDSKPLTYGETSFSAERSLLD